MEPAAILKARKNENGTRDFLVQWSDGAEDSWVRCSSLSSAHMFEIREPSSLLILSSICSQAAAVSRVDDRTNVTMLFVLRFQNGAYPQMSSRILMLAWSMGRQRGSLNPCRRAMRVNIWCSESLAFAASYSSCVKALCHGGLCKLGGMASAKMGVCGSLSCVCILIELPFVATLLCANMIKCCCFGF